MCLNGAFYFYLRIQGGIYDPALDLANEALALEEKMGSKPESMVEIYALLAHVWDQVGIFLTF